MEDQKDQQILQEQDFVSLHNQTYYSILDSIVSPEDLLSRAKELGQKAISITDHGTMASAWTAFKAAKKIGVKLIIGCECFFTDDAKAEYNKFRHIILLAKNHIGYKNLLSLNKEAFDQGHYTKKRAYPVVDWNLLEKHSEGLICLTACGNGIVSQLLMNDKFDEAESALLRLKKIFSTNLGVEVQPNNMKRFSTSFLDDIDQQFLNKKLIELGRKHDIKIVPACNTHYVNKEDHEVHDVFLAIGSGQPVYSGFRLKYNVPDFYLKTGVEVRSFFSRNYGSEFAKQICDNTIYFSDLCEEPVWIDPKYSNPSGKELPVFPVKDQPDYDVFLNWVKSSSFDPSLDEDKLYLRYRCEIEFAKKNYTDKVYRDRLEEEIDVIYYCGISSYMLIVADYTDWSKSKNISVGPGRGSVGGCFIAYLLGIHIADPIKYGLVFARFHNKLKADYSDIDSDFSNKNRYDVIKYIISKYGEDNVASINNFNKITPKVYVRDVSRSCQIGGSREESVVIGNSLAGLLSKDHKTFEDCEKVPLFSQYLKRYPQVNKYREICNKPRSLGHHASGIVISKRKLKGLAPLRIDKEHATLVEYDKDMCEEIGLVKMDILGLTQLDITDHIYELIRQNGKQVPTIDYDLYDKKTYDLISAGNTFGVFQFGKPGAMDVCRRVKPKSLEDLALITTLIRPSSKEIRADVLDTIDGLKPIKVLHPSLENCFKKSFGFPLYDESLLTIAKDVAGWSLAEADKLRKLTKEKGKNPKKVLQWEKEFIEGAVNNGLKESDAKKIWDIIIIPYGRYTFNLSHAIAYSMTSFTTAYLKANYPLEFLMANLIAEINSASQNADDNIKRIKKEIREHKIEILPPDINKSELMYSLKDNKLLTGLNGLRFVGDEAIKDIIEKRPFKSFFDFMTRISSKTVRSNVIQSLAASGALDSFGLTRKQMYLYCQDYRKKLTVWLKKHDPSKEEMKFAWVNEKEWSIKDLYAMEVFIIGEGFVCKPHLAYGEFFNQRSYPLAIVAKQEDKTRLSTVRGIIVDFFEPRIKKEGSKYIGQLMIKGSLQDKDGTILPFTIFPRERQELEQKITRKKAKLEPGLAIHFAGQTNFYEGTMGVVVEEIYDVEMPPLPPKEKSRKLSKVAPEKVESSDEKLAENIEDVLYDCGMIELNYENEENDDESF